MRYIFDQLTRSMKEILKAPIILSELYKAMLDIKLSKLPSPDGTVLEIFMNFWELVGQDYLEMIQGGIRCKWLPHGVIQGLIALLHKKGLKHALTNWHPIIQLKIGYKIYAKAL